MIKHNHVVAFVCILQLMVAQLTLSCSFLNTKGSRGGNSNNMRSENQRDSSSSGTIISPSQVSPGKSEKHPSAIRDIDFKNFTYAWYPSYLKIPNGASEVKLQDGKFEMREDQKKGIRYLLLELDDVSYADLMSDGREEAIVHLGGISVTNRFVGCIFVYVLENTIPKLVWQYETRDRADGGLRRMDVEDGALVIEQYTLEGGAGLCCPKKFIRRHFKWDGKEFRNVRSETLLDDKTK